MWVTWQVKISGGLGTQAAGHQADPLGASLSHSRLGTWIQRPAWRCKLRAGIQGSEPCKVFFSQNNIGEWVLPVC